ncbi:MAG: carbohydrate-binding domain-containing protein [Lachnospiraceae bacterium]|nr:carbohydrate-binding domain-containing protein [Lachnospiraceae bacterium]
MRTKNFLYVICMLLIVSVLSFGCSSSEKEQTKGTDTDIQAEDRNSISSVDKDTGSTGDTSISSEGNDDENVASSSFDNNAVDVNSDNATDTSSSDTARISGELLIESEEKDAVKEDGNKYILSKGGEYHVRGTCENRVIYVDAPDQDLDIHLEGVNMTSEIGALIYVENAEEVTVSATDGTNNVLSDNRAARKNKNEEPEYGNAAIYSKDDLKFKGRGRLTVNGSYNNGIGCKNDIKIKNLTLIVSARNNGIKGNDSVTVESGNITINATDGNGIKTENNHISDKGNQKGYITISGGKVDITSGDKSIDASYDTVIDSVNATVTTNK